MCKSCVSWMLRNAIPLHSSYNRSCGCCRSWSFVGFQKIFEKKKGRIGKDKEPKDDDEIIEWGTIQERLLQS